ncbi:PASTA domain-containing penicillin-binding protein [Numidum massiliense]|uniref:PASTA domain-containing penicillin-binding protein n=1 Tax=Numidum massiliense TaxID=1522315 RepID=UPI0006D5436A|nr:PASTA domain-containing penicillin-binding protein [Numidum massiliense]
MRRPTKEARLRSLLIGLVLTVLLTVIVLRLFWIQGVKAEEYTKRAKQMWEREEVLKPKRGNILDRNNKLLAMDGPAFTIAVYLPTFRQGAVTPKQAAEKLAPLLKMEKKDLVKRLSQKDVEQVELKTSGYSYKITEEVKDKVIALNIPGVHAIPTTKRLYLDGTLAAHVLGFLNNESNPIKGVEATFNDELHGKSGELHFSQDGGGTAVPNRDKLFKPPKPGKDIVLTIDWRLQKVIENVLDQAVKTQTFKGATAIIMNPKNGDILALANRPTFDPNAFYDATEKQLTNFATESAFEPGSTFKTLMLAAAIEEGKFHPDERFKSGKIKVSDQMLYDWDRNGWGTISYAEGVQLSSNVLFVKLEQQLGKEMDRYIERFGFGKYGKAVEGTPTGIELPEAKGLLPNPDKLGDIERATTSYGHGFAVTPIQLITATSAAINGGTLYRPQLIKEVRDAETGEVVEKREPSVTRKHVISEETSRQVRDLLHSVVAGKKGTGRAAQVPGYSIGGKTGTATKYDSPYSYVSFVGFAPVDDPEVVLLLAVDEPVSRDATGGQSVAPMAGDMLAQILPLLHVEKNEKSDPEEERDATKINETEQMRITLPNLVDASAVTAERTLADQSLHTVVLGAGERVIDQLPQPGKVDAEQTVYLLTEKASAVPMPDLRSLSMREAWALCDMLGLDVQLEGEGYVYAQSIAPGERLFDVKEVKLVLKPGKAPDRRKKTPNEATQDRTAQGEEENEADAAGDPATQSTDGSGAESNGADH